MEPKTKMPHIHTGPGEHDHTASAIIVRTDGDQPKILLHMHKKLNRLLQPGGHIELNETPWQAILHEIKEETGYDGPTQLRLLQPHMRITHLNRGVVHPQPVVHATHRFADLDHNHTDIVYAFTTQSDPQQKPGEGESTDLRWLTKEDLHNLNSDQIYIDTVELCDFVLSNILTNWEEVNLSEFVSNK